MLKCDPAAPGEDIINETARVLTGGGTVVVPTETQYGLAARADSDASGEKIERIKKRAEASKSAVFVRDMNQAAGFCRVSERAGVLADKFLPGPLTLVMPALEGQDILSARFCSEFGFGVRISSAPFIKALMDRVEFPVSATSANLSGRVTSSDILAIRDELGEEVDLYIDAGEGACRARVPSTVVAINDIIRLLRPGIIPESEINKVLGR